MLFKWLSLVTVSLASSVAFAGAAQDPGVDFRTISSILHMSTVNGTTTEGSTTGYTILGTSPTNQEVRAEIPLWIMYNNRFENTNNEPCAKLALLAMTLGKSINISLGGSACQLTN